MRDWRTRFCFFDETGTLNPPAQKGSSITQRYFGVGMVKCAEPAYMLREIQQIRQRAQFYEEMKWSELRQNRWYRRHYREVVEAFFKTRSTWFACIMVDKSQFDVRKHFGGNRWLAYERLARLLIELTTAPNELLSVIADDLSTPGPVSFEPNVKRKTNGKLGRLAVGGVCRVDSRGVQLLQVADLLLGAVAYDHMLKDKLINNPDPAKMGMVHHLRNRLGWADLTQGRHSKVTVLPFRAK